MSKIFKNNKGQVIAELEGTILKKKVSFKLHHLRSYKGWAIDQEVIDTIKDKCTDIEIYDIDSKKLFKTIFQTFWSKKFLLPDYGYGKQYYLGDKHWVVEVPGQTKLI